MSTTTRKRHPLRWIVVVALACAAYLALLSLYPVPQPEPGDDVHIEGTVVPEDGFYVEFTPGVTDPFEVCLDEGIGGAQLIVEATSGMAWCSFNV